MRKLNIAIVCDGITNTTAGSFISSLRFSEILRKRGHKVIFITSKSPGNNKIEYFNDFKTYRFFSVLLPKTEGQLYLSFPSTTQIKNILIQEKIDIVHIMIPTPSSISALRAARSLGINVVASSHTQPENLFLHLPKYFPLEKMNNLFYKYMNRIYKNAEFVICPSKFAEKTLKKHNPNLNTCIISNGADTTKFKIVKSDDLIKKFLIPKKSKKMIFVGRLHPEKNIETLIQSMPHILKEYKDVHTMIIGFGHMTDHLKKLTKDLGLEKSITFCGKVTDHELKMAYSLGDIFVLPSLAELEGMAVLEAMACKTPILIANSKESASVDFVDGNGFLFTPKDPKDLAKKALILLKNDKLREEMAIISYKNSRDFDIQKSIDKLEKVYYQSLKKKLEPIVQKIEK